MERNVEEKKRGEKNERKCEAGEKSKEREKEREERERGKSEGEKREEENEHRERIGGRKEAEGKQKEMEKKKGMEREEEGEEGITYLVGYPKRKRGKMKKGRGGKHWRPAALVCRKLITPFVRAFRNGRQAGRYCIVGEMTLGMGPFCRFLATEVSDKQAMIHWYKRYCLFFRRICYL